MIKFNRTKIVATIGPASSSIEMLRKIIEQGVDVCRLNFSHGSYDDHLKVIENINKVNEELDSPACILLDLQGPKLRIGEVAAGGIHLTSGETIEVTTEKMIGTAQLLSVDFPHLPVDINEGERILLDDGKIELLVLETDRKKKIKAKVIYGGVLTSKKGFNLPDTKLSIPSLTEKDKRDLEFGLQHGVDWVGLSFVRKADDIIELKQLIKQHGSDAYVVAKIEKPEAVRNLEEILQVTDAAMVARGDLGVEMPMEDVPIIQKRIVKRGLELSKPVIIATQMMESMITNPNPTRAEANDVANAVMDGADAVMLSAETSVGQYPVKVVEAMQRIIANVEENTNAPFFKGKRPDDNSPTFMSDEVCFTAVRMSDHLNANAITGLTQSGYTGFKIASFRPKAHIYIFTANKRLLTRMNLVWGVRSFYYNKMVSTDETFNDINQGLKKQGLVAKGEVVINTASMPIHERLRTNSLKITVID
ncbi:MAG: pyruvate kinase [Bacteroidia bacterium]|nr:pyruvate kinase [Bacteroidia bacterium]